MVDNSHVVVVAGTGAEMIPAPEMVAFAECYGFVFHARAKGDANRSARVEAPFHRIERGFLLGENFRDWTDLNQQAWAICETWNAKFSTKLHASRREQFVIELPRLRPLPLHSAGGVSGTRESSMLKVTCTSTASVTPLRIDSLVVRWMCARRLNESICMPNPRMNSAKLATRRSPA